MFFLQEDKFFHEFLLHLHLQAENHKQFSLLLRVSLQKETLELFSAEIAFLLHCVGREFKAVLIRKRSCCGFVKEVFFSRLYAERDCLLFLPGRDSLIVF